MPNRFRRADKESGNCRLEANYAHQQELDMIPLLCEQGYKPKVGSGSGKLGHSSCFLIDAQFDSLLRRAGSG